MSMDDPSSLDVVCVGDAIIDAFLTIESTSHCRLLEKDPQDVSSKAWFCVNQGEKIPVDSCQFELGGNACNLSVGLSRLGLKSALYAEIGDDEFSQKIINGLAKENVDQSLLQRTKGAASSFAIGINFKGERTLFVEHVKRKHNFSFDNVLAKWVYLTSLGEEWEKAYRNTIDFARSKGVKLAFSPGTHQLSDKNELILDALKVSEILFVNKEEAITISKIKYPASQRGEQKSKTSNTAGNEEMVLRLLQELQGMGVKNVVITDGLNGSYAINNNGQVFYAEVFPSNEVERTGAGDAYATGTLAGMLYNLSLDQAMRWGAVNAASVVEKIGAQAGLLGREEIERRLEEHKDFR